MLDPVTYELLGKEKRWDEDFGRSVARPLLRYISTQRGMSTPLKFAGKTTSPGMNVPPMHVFTEELPGRHDDLPLVQKHAQTMIKQLSGGTPQPDSGSAEPGTPTGPEVKAGAMDPSAWRIGALAAYDIRLTRLFDTLDVVGFLSVDEALCSVRRIASELRKGDEREPMSESEVTLGLEQVREMIKGDRTGGLGQIFSHVSPDKGVLFLDGAAAYIHWFGSGSPILVRIFELLGRYVLKQDLRVVIYCDAPLIQQ